MRFFRELTFYLFLAIIALFVLRHFFADNQSPQNLTWDEFLAKVEADEIVEVDIYSDGQIEGKFRPVKGGEPLPFVSRGPSPSLASDVYEGPLGRAGVPREYKQKTEPWWAVLLPSLLPILILLGFWFFIVNQMQSSGSKAMAFGKSRARLYTEENAKVTFDDVAGAEEAKD